jgi:putative DNA primase/helicase
MFRVLLLSTGEVGSAAQINAAGQKNRAGHDVRMVELPADAGRGCGLFDSKGTHGSTRDLATALIEWAGRDYGHAGPRFVERLARERVQVAADARARIDNFVEVHCPYNADGQVLRVAARFGLVVFAGELATCYGLTGWQYNAVEDAVGDAFNAWLQNRGTAGAKEPADMVAQVRAFIEQHGGSQYQSIDDEGITASHEQRIMYRAGWRKQRDGATLYMTYPEKFKNQVCEGYDHREVCRALLAAGILVPQDGADKRFTRKERVPNAKNPVPFYCIDGDRLFGHRDD